MSKILLIDDDPINNFLNKSIISERISPEIIVKDFLNPEEALESLINQSANDKSSLPDVIFLDINMPEMSGFEFLDLYIKNKLDNLNIPIYILTSSLDPSDIELSKSYSIVKDFISKPMDADVIRKIIT
ncbi:MAG TPA: response regulator [Bacteroidia bacterium]|jgi:CheY-like chemotaxis protein|nr:response regulator [Bacteroidia bacterium]HQF28042.1 response regulator [Bacteroidia bacterium]HQK96923.1 response regulator [Bacteroidia bacterium]